MSYFDLGSYSMKVTASSQDAQTWFDRGLTWVYAYNHEEAITCFEKALEINPDCALAHWGIAYAVGPNYNKPWELEPKILGGSSNQFVGVARRQQIARKHIHAKSHRLFLGHCRLEL